MEISLDVSRSAIELLKSFKTKKFHANACRHKKVGDRDSEEQSKLLQTKD